MLRELSLRLCRLCLHLLRWGALHRFQRLGRRSGQGQLRIETFNSTGLSQLQRRLQTTSAWIVLAQEIGLDTAAKLDKFHSWLAARGWKALIVPSASGNRGSTSAGTAVICRSFVGLRGLDPTDVNSHRVCQHRVCCSIVSPPGQPAMAVYSAYFMWARVLEIPT